MTKAGDRTVLDDARDAAGRGSWQDALDLLEKADSAGLLGATDLAELADVAYAAGHLDVTIATWERAHRELLAADDPIGAAGAAVRVAMHLLFDTALMAPVRGWLRRAEALLPEGTATPVHAWLAVVRSYERILSGDRAAARACAEQAVEQPSHDPAAGAIARVALARVVILDGDVENGLALLDEAGVAALAGDLDPLSTGVVYCEVVCALQGLAQYDLAEQWTDAMERWSDTNAVGSVRGRCRVHRAEILRLRGSCQEAEEQALQACEEMRPYVHRELGWPLTELGRIRMRRGDTAGAEQALMAAHQAGWDAEPHLALLHLGRGDTDLATAAIHDALVAPSFVPSKELPPSNELRRAPLLDAQVDIALAAGDPATARTAAEALEAIAARFRSSALQAGALHAQAKVRLAEGDAPSAAQLFSDALRAWADIGAPFEMAQCRRGLAEAQRASGNEQAATREEREVVLALDRISAPAAMVDRPRSEPASMLRHDGDYWTVVFDGRQMQIRDLKGLRYLATLLATPGQEHHVLDLVASEFADGRTRHSLGDAGELLDAAAKDAYRRRLTEIDDDIDDARASGDTEREAQAQFERDFLVQELARAVGIGGRDRRASAASERARAAVTQTVRKAMTRLATADRRLGEHLVRTIRTGTYCSYVPDPRLPTRWLT